MKKTNLAKALSLVFVCVMLLCALALTAFATEGENVDIVAANVNYGETYQIMYLVDAPEGATIEAKDSQGNTINVKPFGTGVYKGVEYPAYILEKGVAAQAIDEVITLSVEYNGKKATKNYSVLQYVYDRLYGTDNPAVGAEKTMFEALLDYATKADQYFNEISENPIENKPALNAYQYVTATGITVNGINPKGVYAPGVAPFANIDAIEYDAEKYELAITVNGETKTLDELKALVVGDTKIDVVVEIVEKAHEHSYTSVVTDPTCIAAGYTTYTCECGHSYTEAGEAATGEHVDNDGDGVCDTEGCEESVVPEAVTLTIPEALAAESGTKVIVSGTVCEINTPWNDSFGNISVYITDESGAKILCYRMKTDVVKGDIITVTGDITEFNGANQIINGTAVISGHDDSYDVGASEVTIGEALELADGTDVIVTGVVVNIGTPWSDSYGNISVTIKDENGDELYLFRLATNVALNDIIKVTGSMTTYKGARQVGEGATADIIGTHECTEFTDATCLELSACVICGATKGELADHDYVDGVCSVCGHKEGEAEPVDLTLTFDKANRTEFTTSKQVWAQNGIILTNEKGGSTSNVADYAKPARFYKSSKIVVEVEGKSITKIVFDCNSNSYATDLKNSIKAADGMEIAVSGDKVTVTFTTAVASFTIASLTGGQVRMDGITVSAI